VVLCIPISYSVGEYLVPYPGLKPLLPSVPLQPLHLDNFPVRADYQSQLAALVLPKDTNPQSLSEEFVGGIIAVNEVPDLFICHTRAFRLAQARFLLQPPLVDVLRVLGVDVNEGVEMISDLVVGLESGIDVLDAREGVVAQAAAVVGGVGAGGFGCRFPFLAQGGRGKGTKTDGPAFEEDDFYGWLLGVGCVD
jgi:hypothetical protein